MSKSDAFSDALRDAAAKFSDPGLRNDVEVVLLRNDLERVKAERKHWMMLVAAILHEQGEMRVSKATLEALGKPTIIVKDDPETSDLVLRLKL